MLPFSQMLRFIIIATISLLISFGAISKSQKFSSLLNHVTQDHIVHSHDHHENHHHKHSDKKTNNEKNHSHDLDLSLLTQVFTVEIYKTDAIIRPLSVTDVLAPFANISLLPGKYSFSIFRPPIA